MRQAGIIQDGELARQFADYLLSQGITTQIDQVEGGWAVWIHDDEQLMRSRLELEEFLLDPQAEFYRDARAQADAIRRKAEQLRQKQARNIVDVRGRWRPWTEGRFPLTWILIGLSVGLSLATDFGHNEWASRWLYIVPFYENGTMWKPGLGLSSIREGQVWRLITPIFLQVGGWGHLAGNMWWLFMAGALVETRRGTLILLGLAIVMAVASNLAQYWSVSPSFGGMSGVGFGLFGYIWMKSLFDPTAGIYTPPDLVVQFLVFLVLCMTGILGPIANAAHVVGLITGMLLGYGPVLVRRLF